MSVEFQLFNNTHRSLKNSILNISTGGKLAKYAGKTTGVKALESLNFNIRAGDRVGLLGHNGSGKTTLLRTLAGAYEPTSGSLEIHGKVASLLDVSLGMDVDATGIENIYLRGIMMGLRRYEIESKIEEIAEFTELGEFLDMPIRTYSSGMHLRLAFAVSTSVRSDIIIMDEWLSVGDSSFREKAAKRLNTVVENASILVIASHDPDMLKNLCNRFFRLSHGNISEISTSDF